MAHALTAMSFSLFLKEAVRWLKISASWREPCRHRMRSGAGAMLQDG
jgi:hypothetical protein